MVTGASGLVGQGLRAVTEAKDEDTFIWLSSKVRSTQFSPTFCAWDHISGALSEVRDMLKVGDGWPVTGLGLCGRSCSLFAFHRVIFSSLQRMFRRQARLMYRGSD